MSRSTEPTEPTEPNRHRAATRRRRRVGDLATSLLAELLIIGGVGAGLFVAYTAWWTDVVAGSVHTRLVDELGQAATKAGGTKRTTTPPVLDEPGAANVFGTMQIPRFGDDVKPIGQGTDRAKVLNTIGLGHYEGTAMPGGSGNFSVAGHRVTYGKPLNEIAELKEGDPIVTRVTDKERGFDVWYVYRVTGSRIVAPSQVEVIAPVPSDPDRAPRSDDRTLTLTACHPMWSAAERYVVHADFDYWMQASDGTPKELER